MFLLEAKNTRFNAAILAKFKTLPPSIMALMEASSPHIDAYRAVDPILRRTVEKQTKPFHRAQEAVCLAIRRILPIAINVDNVNWLLEGGYVQHSMSDVEMARTACQAAIDVFYETRYSIEDFSRRQDPGSRYRPPLASMALDILSIDEEGREWPTAYLRNHPNERNYTQWTQIGTTTRLIKFEYAPIPETI